MAIVRISRGLELEIERNVEKLFNARKQVLLNHVQESQLGLKLYMLSLPFHVSLEVIVGVIQAGYGGLTKEFAVKTPAGHRFVYSLPREMPRHTVYSSHYSGWTIPETNQHTDVLEFRRRVADYEKAYADHKQVLEAFRKLLASVPTLNKAIVAFPELENYVDSQTMARLRAPSERAKAVKSVPTLIEDEVRATLIKAKILADTKERKKE